MPSVHPNTAIPNTTHHPNVHSTLPNRNRPVLRPTYMPMETRDTVHFQQRFHYNFSACPMTFYDSHTQICHSFGHYPYPKKPRIDGGKLKTMTKNSRQKVTPRVSQKKRTARRKPLPSPPPLIRKCEVNSGFDDKKGKTPNLEDPAEKIFFTTDKSLERHSDTTRETPKLEKGLTNTFVVESPIKRNEFSMSGFESEPNREVATSNKVKGQQKKNTPRGHDTSPLDNKQNDESTACDGGRKGTWYQQPNNVEMESSTRSTQHWTPLEEARHHMATNEDSHQKRRMSFSVKLQHDSSMVLNDNSCDDDVSQGGQHSPQGKKRHTMTLNRQQTLNTPPKDCRENGIVSSDNKTTINDESAKYSAMSSLEQRECHTELFERQPHMQLKHSSSLPNDMMHPQLLYYPPSKTNAQMGRSKSCDDTQGNFTFKSQASTTKFHRPEVSSYKSQLMQSENAREQGFKNKFTEYNVPICSPTERQYQRSNVVVCDGAQTSHNVQKSGDEMPSVSSHGFRNKSTTQADLTASYQSVSNDSSKSNVTRFPCERHVRGQTMEMDQTRATITFARPTLQTSNVSSESGKDGSILPSNLQNQLFSRQQSCDRIHTPIYSDPNQNATLRNNYLPREQCRKLSPVANPNNPKLETLRQGQNGKHSMVARKDSFNRSGIISLNELQKRRVKLSEDQNRPNNRPRFDFNGGKDVSHNPIDVASVTFQDQPIRPSTHYHCKLTDTERFGGHQIPTDLPCDEHCRQQKRRFSTNKTTVVQCPHSLKPMGEQMRYQGQEDHYSNRKLSTPTCENKTSPIHTAGTRSTSGGCDQAVDTLHVQQTCSESRNLPPLPSGSDWDNIDSGCGGYAIDHNALPRIVAVHSIVTQDEALQESGTDLFSATDKKYWSDLLQKLTVNVNEDSNFQPGKTRKIFKESHTNNIVDQSQMDTVKDITYPVDKDYSSQQEGSNAANLYSNVKKWTLLKYLSSPSKELTIEVKGPMECVEDDETETKQHSPRRKLTVSELSKKILYTRERIKKETIPWKKKLLFSLEATFIRRLRKTEKETGEKADIVIDEEKGKEESNEENAEKVKCNNRERKKKIAPTKGPKPRAIITKE